MKTVALAVLLLATGFAGTASAQYYGPPRDYGPPRGGYDYDDRPPPRRGGYDRGYDDDRPRRGPPPVARGSSTCVTSRGVCPIGAVVPRLTPCGCEVPGFGYKRGAAS